MHIKENTLTAIWAMADVQSLETAMNLFDIRIVPGQTYA
jgi:hypothetical protein